MRVLTRYQPRFRALTGAVLLLLAFIAPARAAPPSADVVERLQAEATRLDGLADRLGVTLTDPDELASALKTQDAAFGFVRDQIALEPYAGAMKGALGTLLTRGGNDLDRALLLAVLLKAQGVEARIAHATLPPPLARRLLDRVVAGQGALALQAASLPDLDTPPASDAPADNPMGRVVAARAMRLSRTIETTYDWLSGVLGGTAMASPGTNPKVLAEHYWVEVVGDDGDGVVDLDPSLPTAHPGDRLADAADVFAPNALPAELNQAVTIRLAADYLEDGRIVPTESFSLTRRTADLVGKPIRFSLAPRGTKLATANDFRPILAVGGERTTGTTIQLKVTAEPPSTTVIAPSGGLLGAFSGGDEDEDEDAKAPPASPAAKPGAALARLVLEITLQGPGGPAQTFRRAILDRTDQDGAGARLMPVFADDNAVRGLMLQIWDLAAAYGPLTPPAMMRVDAVFLRDLADGTAETLRVAAAGTTPDPASLPRFGVATGVLHYFAASDYTRAALAIRDAPDCRDFYTAPRLAFMRHGTELADLGGTVAKIRYRESIDVVNSPLGFACATTDPTALALKSGIADTVLETLLGGAAETIDAFRIIAAARSQSISLSLAASPADLPQPVSANPLLARALAAAFARGSKLVVPAGLVTLGGARTYGWWEIGRNGCALGRLGGGGGQAATERGIEETEEDAVTEGTIDVFADYVKCMTVGTAKAMAVESWNGDLDTPTGAGNVLNKEANLMQGCVFDALCSSLMRMGIGAVAGGMFKDIVEQAKESIIMSLLGKGYMAGNGFLAGELCKSGIMGEGGEGGASGE